MKLKKVLLLTLSAAMILCACPACAEGNKGPDLSSLSDVAIRQAAYPTRAKTPDYSDYEKVPGLGEAAYSAAYSKWREEKKACALPEDFDISGMQSFATLSSRQILSKDSSSNLLYSPVNVYFALCMLAETTAGSSQKQVLEALGEDSIESLRTTASALWNAVYCDDGRAKTYLGSSLWLRDDMSYNRQTVDILADTYYASTYRGKMGSKEMNDALRTWLSSQTGGLLDTEIAGVGLDSRNVMALATTIYFSGKWTKRFSESKTEDGIFHSPSGDESTRFMVKKTSESYYYGDGFAAVNLGLSHGEAKMWLILPDEGTSAQSLLSGEKVFDLILNGGKNTDSKHVQVNLRMPKFDVKSSTDLKGALKAMGLSDVFDIQKSDFSPLTTDSDVYVSEVSHTVRVLVDEEGCEAAAYTIIQAPGAAAPPDDEVDFFLDRPFIFAITNSQNIPLFMGIVNRP